MLIIMTKLIFENVVDFKKQYLEGLHVFIKNELNFFVDSTSNETLVNLAGHYDYINVNFISHNKSRAFVRLENEGSACSINFGCEFLLCIHSIVCAYYLKHGNNATAYVQYEKNEILDLIEAQSPYVEDDWSQQAEQLSFDLYLIAKENIQYIILFILYHELSHLAQNHLDFIKRRKELNLAVKNSTKWINKFVEMDADILASHYYIRRLFSYPLSTKPNGDPLDYPKEQTVYFILGSIGLLFSLEDLLDNKNKSSLDYLRVEEYSRSNYLHPTVRCNVVRMQMHITLEKLDYQKEVVTELAELMRYSGRSLLMSMSKAMGFDSERWDLHREKDNHEIYAMEAWEWYHDHKDLLIQKIQQSYEKL